MTYEESPSLDVFRNGLPEKLPDPHARRRAYRIIIGFLMILITGLTVTNFMNTGTVAVLFGTGTVSGTVYDEDYNGVQAEIFVLGTDIFATSGINGQFSLDGVPSGDQTVVVAYKYIGRELPVRIYAGDVSDLGTISVIAREVPGGYGQADW